MKIASYVEGATWGNVNPDTLGKGLGGRESATVYLTEEWAAQGHDATLFAPNDEAIHIKHPSGGESHYLPMDMGPAMLSCFDYDAVVAWEAPGIFAVPGVAEGCGVKLCGMQVAHVSTADPRVLSLPDVWVALSPWAGEFLKMQSPHIQNVLVQPNCALISRFPKRIGRANEIPHFLYASSPDRGLVHLLRAWPKFREAIPGCKLRVAYGVDNFVNHSRWSHYEQGEMAIDIERLLDQEGIEYLGKIGQDVLARVHAATDVFTYSCDPCSPTETGAISVIEALAAGDVPVITDADCLPSEFGKVTKVVPLPWYEDDYIDAVIELLDDEKEYRRLQVAGRKFAEKRDWKLVSRDWIKMIKKLQRG